MKNFILFNLFFIISFTFYSQSQKKDIKLGVSFSPLVSKTESVDSGISGIVLRPSIAYYVSNKSSIELNFTYATSNDIEVTNIPSNYHSYAITPVFRYNFINNSKLRLFGEAGYGLGSITFYANEDELRNSTHKFLSGVISVLEIGVGANYLFNNKWGFELSVPYINSKTISASGNPELYNGIAPTLGIIYIL